MVTKLITLGVIVLGVIALAQLMRIYELTSKLRKTGEHEISNRDNKINAKLWVAFMVFLYAGFFWLMLEYGWTGGGDAASVHGANLDWLLNLNFIIIIAVFFLTNTLLFMFSYKYVKEPGVKAFYYPHNNKLEMIWTVVPACVLAVIIILGLQSWTDATGQSKPEAIRIELFSKQFDWTARYSGEDNTLGRHDYKLTNDDNNPLGLLTAETIKSAIENMEASMDAIESELNNDSIMMVPKDRASKETDLSRKSRLIRLLHQMEGRHNAKNDDQVYDDVIQLDTLYLCKGKEYEFNFRSKDVIHSAYFPHFRAQMNTVPGMVTRFKFIPSKTTAEMRVERMQEDFNFILMCNKICGGAHYKMKMMVVVMEEEDYNNWWDAKKKMTFRSTFFASDDSETAASEESMTSTDSNQKGLKT